MKEMMMIWASQQLRIKDQNKLEDQMLVVVDIQAEPKLLDLKIKLLLINVRRKYKLAQLSQKQKLKKI